MSPGNPNIIVMGDVWPTYSCRSSEGAHFKMFDKLEAEGIPICYDKGIKQLFFVVEKSKTRRYIRTRQKCDLFGSEYYECSIDMD